MPSRDEIFEKVKSALVDALGVDDDEVSPSATMVGDLGAESIDFLDIVFRLEKAFGIKIPRGELFPEDVLSSTEFVTNGKVNAAGIAALKTRMPFADLTKFEANPSVQNFANTLTVEDMVRYVQSKLGAWSSTFDPPTWLRCLRPRPLQRRRRAASLWTHSCAGSGSIASMNSCGASMPRP